MINSLATVPLQYVTRAFDKLVAYFELVKSEAIPVAKYWEKNLVKGYIVEETRRTVLPRWKIEEWNIYEKIIKKEETSVPVKRNKPDKGLWIGADLNESDFEDSSDDEDSDVKACVRI